MRRTIHGLLILTLALWLVACGTKSSLDSDGPDDVGLNAGKEDGPFSQCELSSTLSFVNGADISFQVLRDAGVHSRASREIANFRAGADGQHGTADDKSFASIEELDAVRYVGPAAFRQLVAHISELCKTGGLQPEVVFSPQPYESSHLLKVAELIDSAKTSVDFAMYSFSDSRIKEALKRAVERGVVIRAILEAANDHKKEPEGTLSASLEEMGINVRYINKIMHHKFAIVDGPKGALESTDGSLVTGSANWSRSAGTRYDENTIILKGNAEALVRFQQEFDHLWNNSRDLIWNQELDYEVLTPPSDDRFVDDPNLEVLFTSANFKITQSSTYGPTFSVNRGSNEIADRLVELINSARTSIRIASGHLRSRPVAEALIAKRQSDPNVTIQVYLDAQEFLSDYSHRKQQADLETCLETAGTSVPKREDCVNKGFLFSYELHKAGIEVRFKYYSYRWHYSYAAQMHHKYLIIDDQILVSGSYNLSDNAEHATMENMVVYHAAGYGVLIQRFVDNFKTLWETRREGGLAELTGNIETASSSIPLIWDAISLTWPEVDTLKRLIRNTCPAVDSEAYRTAPESHLSCQF